MKYSTVNIRPEAFKPGEWYVTFEDLPYDREPSSGSLSALGFFHYPRKIGRKAAFEKLRTHMIERHEEEIKRLKKSIESLKRVKYTIK